MENKVQKSSTTRNHGGRKKGTPNKSTDYIFDLCEKNNFDPIQALIWVAQNNWKSLGYRDSHIEKQGFQGVVTSEPIISVDHRIDAMKSLTGYMYPKRKAIEMTMDKNSVQPIILAYSKESVKDAAQD